MDYSKFDRHTIFCVDMRSFYASCECVRLGLDPLEAQLAVVGDVKRNGSVVLAASPELKKLGIKTGSRLFEIQKLKKDNIIVVQARMSYYYAISDKIVSIFESFVPREAIHVYSVDESWLTFDGTEKLYKHKSPEQIAQMVIDEIKLQIGIPAAVGIGPNKFIAKTVLDLYAKEKGIFECHYEDVERYLHHIPIGKMWGVGSQLDKHFAKMGITTYGELAKYDIGEIKKRFGVVGERLHGYAWGIDTSPVFYDHNNPPPTAFNFRSGEDGGPIKSVGNGVTFLEDYKDIASIRVAVLDLAEEISIRLRKRKMVGKTISFSVGYSRTQNLKGFSRQITLKTFTSDAALIADLCMELFIKHSISAPVVRILRIAVSKLKEEENRDPLFNTLDAINQKYGKGTLRKAISYTKESIAKDRSGKINGHNK